MLKSYSAIFGQSIFDVCLNAYGALDNLFKLLQDSSGTDQGVDDAPASGQEYIYDDDLVSDQAINQAYTLSGILYATYYGTNGSSMYIVKQRPGTPIPGAPPTDNPPVNPATMLTLTSQTEFISGANGTTVIPLLDENGNSMIGKTVVSVEKEIRPLRKSEWLWNPVTGVLTLMNGAVVDKDETLFVLYTQTVTA